MTAIYVNLILRGLKTLEDVPMKIRLAVENALNAAQPSI